MRVPYFSSCAARVRPSRVPVGGVWLASRLALSSPEPNLTVSVSVQDGRYCDSAPPKSARDGPPRVCVARRTHSCSMERQSRAGLFQRRPRAQRGQGGSCRLIFARLTRAFVDRADMQTRRLSGLGSRARAGLLLRARGTLNAVVCGSGRRGGAARPPPASHRDEAMPSSRYSSCMQAVLYSDTFGYIFPGCTYCAGWDARYGHGC